MTLCARLQDLVLLGGGHSHVGECSVAHGGKGSDAPSIAWGDSPPS